MQTYNKSYKQNTSYFSIHGIFKFILQEINIKVSLRCLKVDIFCLCTPLQSLILKRTKS